MTKLHLVLIGLLVPFSFIALGAAFWKEIYFLVYL